MPRSPIRLALGPVMAVLLACTGCGASSGADAPAGSSASTGPAATATGTAQRVPVAAATGGPVTKLLVVVVENHSLQEMETRMPYIFGLATTFGYAADYTAATHPSLPNYLAITSGSAQGVTDDRPPSAHPLEGPTVFGEALAHGRTAAVYADGMPSACSTSDDGDGYAVRHNAWAYFPAEREQCRAHDLPLSALAGDVRRGSLPDAGMLVPDKCHDAHDCDLSEADDWIRTTLTALFAGPDWRSGRLAVVITADEDDRRSGNKVLTVVVHPSLHGVVVRTPLTHYSLSRLYSEVLGAGPLREARGAPSMAAAFGLPTR